ncbi:hypothetical protein JMG10_05280 [Nostoc ellipsosporum NOK]|nr:hypothetical protein [Nostoc ellipsosporum NOK]
MVTKTQNLTTFKTESDTLLQVINRKIAAGKTLPVNASFNTKLTVDINNIASVINAIEQKFKKCEMHYYGYFENVDHAVLSGNPASLPFSMNCTFIDGTATLKYVYECDDKRLYKEIIDMQFQAFILTTASIYENLVTLAEIIIKKVFVYLTRPQSTKLDDYISLLKILIDLGYRGNDELHRCITAHDRYFNDFLGIINNMRNSFIHGYSTQAATDGFNYKVTTQGAIAAGAAVRNIDLFTAEILANTRNFIRAFYPTLEKSIRHYKKSIPA